MPNGLMAADLSFPKLDGKSEPEKLDTVMNYLYMLLEQLRYTLDNLGRENFNDREFDGIAKTITGPVAAKIEDAEGKLSELSVQAGNISAKVSNLSGRFTALRLTVEGLAITNPDGTTYISGNSVKSGTIEGAILSCRMDSGNSESTGKIQFRYGSRLVGEIKLDTGGSGGISQSKGRLFVSATQSDFPLKLSSAGNSSYQAGGTITITSDTQVILHAVDSVRIAMKIGGLQYVFKGDGIYFGSKKVLDVS